MTYEPRAGRFRGLLCLLLALVSGVSLAAFPSTSGPMATFGSCAAYGSSASAACAALQPCAQIETFGAGGEVVETHMYGASVCIIASVSRPNTQWAGSVGVSGPRCPAGSTLSGSVCTCTAPQVENATHDGCQALPDLCADKAGVSAGRYSAPWSGGSVSTTYVYLCEPVSGSSSPGCLLNVSYDFGADGFKSGSATFTGGGCSPSADSDGSSAGAAPASGTGTTPAAGSPAPTPCKSGTFPGSVNGVSVCVPPSGTGTTVSKTTKDSGATTDGVPTPSVKQEKVTECKGSSCTTTTTTTTTQPTVGGVPGAVTVTVGTTTEGKSGVCTTDPKNPVCAGEGASDCPEDSTSLGCMKLGTPSDGVLSKVTKNIGVAGVDSLEGFAIGHACPADLTFDVMGKTHHVSFSAACDAAPLVKPLVVLAAAIAALFIVYAALTQKT